MDRKAPRYLEHAGLAEALATIPSLKLATCHAATRSSRSRSLSTSDARVFFYDLPTNGIVYADIGFDLHQFP